MHNAYIYSELAKARHNDLVARAEADRQAKLVRAARKGGFTAKKRASRWAGRARSYDL